MKTTALFLICCLATTYSLHLNDIFAEVAQNDFGKTLVQTIQLQLETQDVDYIINTVKGVRKGLQQQKKNADASYKVSSAKCMDDTNFLEKAIAVAEADITKFTGILAIDVPVRDSRTTELANREQELTERVAMSDKLDAERQVEIDRFDVILKEHGAVRAMLEECRTIINSRLRGGEEFLQTSMFSSLSTQLRSFKTADRGLAHGYGAMFSLLAKMVESAPVQVAQNLVDNILNVLNKVEANLDTSLAIERAAEKEREAIYDELKTKVDN